MTDGLGHPDGSIMDSFRGTAGKDPFLEALGKNVYARSLSQYIYIGSTLLGAY